MDFTDQLKKVQKRKKLGFDVSVLLLDDEEFFFL